LVLVALQFGILPGKNNSLNLHDYYLSWTPVT
jgi:hypothetical protein